MVARMWPLRLRSMEGLLVAWELVPAPCSATPRLPPILPFGLARHPKPFHS